MDTILKLLFQSDLDIPQSKAYKRQCSAALDNVLQAEGAVKGELSPEHWKLVANYLEKVRLYHPLDGPFQFERGFLLGAKIMLWVALQKIITSEQL